MHIETLERRRMWDGTILFVRGATRSGGFLDGGSAEVRDEQLADVNNTSTEAGNHGWAALAQFLRDTGFTVQQVTEPKERDAGNVSSGKPIRFETIDLAKYAAIVFASNNARYATESVDAIENYVRDGGGAVFISDANFGSHWRDAPDSDQAFLARFGLIVNQDNGTYTLRRTAGDFATADHPILRNVDEFDGEGVSPVVIATNPPAGVTVTRVAGARGQTRNNDGVDPAENFAGSLRDVTARDASLAVAHAGRGRVVYYFDRNTFFNANGAGTDINNGNNQQLALNLFHYAADGTPPAVTSTSFAAGAPSTVRIAFDDRLYNSVSRRDILLRDPFDGTPIPNANWGWDVTETDGHDELVVRIKGRQAPGTYQLQINPGRITDDSGNANVKRIRFNFTIPPMGITPRTFPQAATQSVVSGKVASVAADIFRDDAPIT
jgi:hypothetical protein